MPQNFEDCIITPEDPVIAFTVTKMSALLPRDRSRETVLRGLWNICQAGKLTDYSPGIPVGITPLMFQEKYPDFIPPLR